eukprot:2493272-Ditylum_brightwellii.AAC.1
MTLLCVMIGYCLMSPVWLLGNLGYIKTSRLSMPQPWKKQNINSKLLLALAKSITNIANSILFMAVDKEPPIHLRLG